MRVLAIDIGGTKTAFAHVDTAELTLQRLGLIDTPPPFEAGYPFFTRVREMVAMWLTDVDAIGISVCELVSPEGDIASGHRVDWRGLPVLQGFSAIVPCLIEADVRCAALAEASFGAGRYYNSFFYLNVGTGISSTLVIGGKPWPGACGNALVFANGTTTVMDRSGEITSYVLEDIAGGAGISREYATLSATREVGARVVLEKAQAGDSIAERVVVRAANAIGNTLAQAVNMLDPEVIVLGGGLSESSFFASEIERAMRNAIWAERTRGIKFLIAERGADAPLFGAALAAEQGLSFKA